MTIYVKNKPVPAMDRGEFILVDLAGSERYEDRKAHSKQLMDESKENNKSLLALKECVRARARAESEDGFVHIPYRTTRLTWLLKPIFYIECTRLAKTLVIAHVSPHIQDVPHSINTLSYAAPFRIIPTRRPPAPYHPEDPRTWDHDATIKWLAKAFAAERAARRQASWDRLDAEARRQNKRIKPSPLPPLREDTPLLLSLENLCPSPHSERYLSRMYSAEWIQACLESALPFGDKDPRAVIGTIKADAVSVYLSLSQMLMRAGTRTRNAVMTSRRVDPSPDQKDRQPSPWDLPFEQTQHFFQLFPSESLEAETIKRFNAGMDMKEAGRSVMTEALAIFAKIKAEEAEVQRQKDLLEANWPGEWVEYVETEL